MTDALDRLPEPDDEPDELEDAPAQPKATPPPLLLLVSGVEEGYGDLLRRGRYAGLTPDEATRVLANEWLMISDPETPQYFVSHEITHLAAAHARSFLHFWMEAKTEQQLDEIWRMYAATPNTGGDFWSNWRALRYLNRAQAQMAACLVLAKRHGWVKGDVFAEWIGDNGDDRRFASQHTGMLYRVVMDDTCREPTFEVCATARMPRGGTLTIPSPSALALMLSDWDQQVPVLQESRGHARSLALLQAQHPLFPGLIGN